MNLIIDFGNSFAKFYLFNNENITTKFKLNYPDFFFSKKKTNFKLDFISTDFSYLENIFLEKNIQFQNVIISSVIDFPNDFTVFLTKKVVENKGKIITLGFKTPIPIVNLYKNKENLGKDRLAAVVGANTQYPNLNILVIDAGSAITYEFISDKNEFLGGNISPGLKMRFKSLNTFTNQLPLIEVTTDSIANFDKEIKIGNNTDNAIINGVFQGLVLEIEGNIEGLLKKHKDSIVFLTGGDAFLLKNKIKYKLLVQPDLVAIGLNSILKYNFKNS